MGKPAWGKTFSKKKHFLIVGSVHIQYCDLDGIIQVRATYCINFLSNTFDKKKILFKSFLAYLMSKHYIAMYHTHHNYFIQG